MVHAEKGGAQPYSGASEILFRVICKRILFLDCRAQRSGRGVDVQLNAYFQIYKPSSFGDLLDNSRACVLIRPELLTQTFASAIQGDILCLAERNPFFLVENACELLGSYAEVIDFTELAEPAKYSHGRRYFENAVRRSTTIPLLSDFIIELEDRVKIFRFDIPDFRWKCFHSLANAPPEKRKNLKPSFSEDLEELREILSK